jgi:ABC-type polysaccharide/polyol phosphate transport system ATPase subunit
LVVLDGVSKTFPQYRRPSDRLLESIPFAPALHGEFRALDRVSLTVGRGETFAIVGPNGSGKSTLLQIVSGILDPSEGTVRREGRVAALLELGAGFNPEFTGRENVYLTGEIQGFSRFETEKRLPAIAGFAEIGGFLDRPVKEYSSGMYVRLAFAAAVHVDPDILIVDEALAVGDARFANRCIRKFDEFKRSGKTILFVSHDLGLVKRLADRAALLVEGKVAALGAPGEVVNRYVALVHAGEDAAANDASHGDGVSRILSVTPLSSIDSGERASIEIRAEARRDCPSIVVGLLIRNSLGIDVYGTNTRVEGLELGPFAAGERFAVRFAFRCLLTRGDYTLTVATQHADGRSQDWRDDFVSFTVIDARDHAGVANLEAEVAWERL